MNTPFVTVIIPTLNEASNLPYVAQRMPDGIDEIIVVDGRSTDDTKQVARDLWPHALIIDQSRKGKGNALACGFEAARGDIIVMIDADGSTDAAEIPFFVQALLDGADFAKGSRFTPGAGSADITQFRRAGNRGLNGLVNACFRFRFTDLCYGYNAFWSYCLPYMNLPDTTATEPQWGDGFEIETLINVRIALAAFSIAEVASYERDRIHGDSNLAPIRDGIRVLRTIAAERSRSRSEPGPDISAVLADGRRVHDDRRSALQVVEEYGEPVPANTVDTIGIEASGRTRVQARALTVPYVVEAAG